MVLRLFDAAAPEHDLARRAVRLLERKGNAPAIALQVLVEAWVVATRPVERNGLGWPTEAATALVAAARSRFVLLVDDETTAEHWQRIVADGAIRGKRAHDARIIASMRTHGIERILTFNTKDFEGIEEIVILDPRSFGS